METVTLNDILYVVLTAAVPLVLRFVYQFISAKVEGTRYGDAIDAVYSAVEYVNQTFVDALKAEGNFDTDAQLKAFDKAKDAALEIMSKSTVDWLERTHIDLDAWLTVQIEAAVKAVK